MHVSVRTNEASAEPEAWEWEHHKDSCAQVDDQGELAIITYEPGTEEHSTIDARYAPGQWSGVVVTP